MTRFLARLSLLVLVCLVAAGPAFAAPLRLGGAPTVRAESPRPAQGVNPLAWVWALPVVFGAIRVKDVGTIAKKFVQRASAAAPDYKDGVQAAGGDWEANTKASEDNYAQGTQAAISQKRFGKGVAKAGAAKYIQKATTLGAQRYPTGVAASESAFSAGMGPVLQTIASLTLAPRRPKGDPANMQRAQQVASALRAMKVGS